jgi:hypothetical protein
MWKTSCRKNEEFENAKEVIEICKSKKDRQHNDQRKNDKTLHRKLKIE